MRCKAHSRPFGQAYGREQDARPPTRFFCYVALGCYPLFAIRKKEEGKEGQRKAPRRYGGW